jgi:hypothetical protein
MFLVIIDARDERRATDELRLGKCFVGFLEVLADSLVAEARALLVPPGLWPVVGSSLSAVPASRLMRAVSDAS